MKPCLHSVGLSFELRTLKGARAVFVAQACNYKGTYVWSDPPSNPPVENTRISIDGTGRRNRTENHGNNVEGHSCNDVDGSGRNLGNHRTLETT